MVAWTSFISYRTTKLFNSFFKRFGELAYKKPCFFISIGLIITAIAGSGLMCLEQESSITKLWVPQSSPIYRDLNLQESAFGSSPTQLILLLQAPNNHNIFTPKALTQASEVRHSIHNINASYNGNPYAFHDLCARTDMTSNECTADYMNLHSIFFGDSEMVWSDPACINAALNSAQMPYVAGALQHNGSTVCGANVIRILYDLQCTSDEELMKIQLEYEEAFVAYWDQHNDDYSEFNVLYYTTHGLDREMLRTATQDFIMFAIAAGVMLVYLQSTLGGFSCIHARPLLATTALFILLCALIFGFGICAYLGMKFSTLVFAVPFLLLGVGVDDMIIIVDTLNRTPLPDKFDKDNARAKQLGLALQHSGVSISLTSFCSVVAFAVGSITDLPGLEYFCMFAAWSFLGMYILQFLLFVPLLVFDNERIYANRNFCCPCVVQEEEETFTPVPQSDDEEEETIAPFCSLNGIVQRSLITVLSSTVGRVCVILVFMAITALSAYCATQVVTTSDVTMLVPDDSYIGDYFHLTFDAWPGLQAKEIEIILVDIDISDADVRQRVHTLIRKVEDVPDVVGPVENWLDPFTIYVNETKGVHIDSIEDRSTFYSYLKDFEQEFQFCEWADELVFDDDENPTQITTRFYFNALQPSEELKRYDCYLFFNGLVDEVMGVDSKSFTKSFMMQEEWTYFYLAYALKGYTVKNLIVAACAVLVILVFLMDIRLAVFIMFIILCIDVCLFGWMYLVGIDLQVVSFAQLCMAVGLTVDYVIHMVHAIAAVELKAEDDGYEKRIRVAMLGTGSSVIKGAFTTFLGASVLAFSNSYAFRSFFMMLAGIIIIASLFGLVVAPALMGQFPCIYSRLVIPHPQTDQSEGSGTESAHATPGIGYNPLASHSIMQTAEDLGIEKDDDEYSIELSPIRHDLGEGQEQTTTEEISMELII
eukprot:651444_1